MTKTGEEAGNHYICNAGKTTCRLSTYTHFAADSQPRRILTLACCYILTAKEGSVAIKQRGTGTGRAQQQPHTSDTSPHIRCLDSTRLPAMPPHSLELIILHSSSFLKPPGRTLHRHTGRRRGASLVRATSGGHIQDVGVKRRFHRRARNQTRAEGSRATQQQPHTSNTSYSTHRPSVPPLPIRLLFHRGRIEKREKEASEWSY